MFHERNNLGQEKNWHHANTHGKKNSQWVFLTIEEPEEKLILSESAP